MTSTVKAEFRPIDLYNAFPHSDLLPIDPPTAVTTWPEFAAITVDCGDSLFRHLVLELGDYPHDQLELEDQYHRCTRAMLDIEEVLTAIERIMERKERPDNADL